MSSIKGLHHVRKGEITTHLIGNADTLSSRKALPQDCCMAMGFNVSGWLVGLGSVFVLVLFVSLCFVCSGFVCLMLLFCFLLTETAVGLSQRINPY